MFIHQKYGSANTKEALTEFSWPVWLTLVVGYLLSRLSCHPTSSWVTCFLSGVILSPDWNFNR